MSDSSNTWSIPIFSLLIQLPDQIMGRKQMIKREDELINLNLEGLVGESGASSGP
jgi:hypothetical protein